MDDKVLGQVEILTGLVGNLQDSVGSLNSTANTFATSVQDLTAVIGNAESGIGNFNNTLSEQQEAFEGVKAAAEGAAESVDDYTKMMRLKTEAVQKDLKKRYGSFVDSNTSIMMAGLNKMTGGFMTYAKQQREIFNNLENQRERFFFAFDTFRSHMSFFMGIGTSLFNVFKGLMTTLINVGKLIITLPLKSLETMLDIGHSIREEYLAISQTLEDTQEFFSSTSAQGQGFARLTAQIRGLGGAFLNVNSEASKTFGIGLQGQQAMAAAGKDLVTGMGTLSNLFGPSYQDNLIKSVRITRALGMTAEDNSLMIRRSMSLGIHPFTGLANAIHASSAASKEFGIDQKQVAIGMNGLRKNVIEFSHISEDELGKVVARAAQLGVEVEGLNAIFNKFTTFDAAAESAALLSQTFGMAIDAMDIIRADNPMEILDQFREGMMQTGRDFNDLNRHEKALLSQYTGLNGEMLQTAMSFEGIGLSYQELQQKMEDASPENQLKEAVKEMSGSIKEFMNVGKKITSPFQALSEGMKDALVKNTQFQRSMMGLSNSIQNIYTKVLNNFLSRDLLNSIDNIIGTFSKLIDDDVANGFVKISRNLGSFINVLIGANSTADQVNSSFSKLYDSILDSKFVSRLIDIGQRMIGGIVSGFIKSLPSLIGGFTDLLKLFNGTLDKQSYSNPNTGMGKFFKKYIIDSWNQVKGVLTDKKNVNGEVVTKGLVTNLLDELKEAIGVSASLFADIGELMLKGIWQGMSALWGSLDWKEKGIAAALLLGPSFASTLATFVGGKVFSTMLGGGASQAVLGAGGAGAGAGISGALGVGGIGLLTSGKFGDLTDQGVQTLKDLNAKKKLSVGEEGLRQALKRNDLSRTSISRGKFNALLSGDSNVSKLSRLGNLSGILGGGLMIGKDLYDYFDESQASKKGENIGGVAGGVILGGIGTFLGGPVGAALGASIGNTLGNFIGSFWDDEEEKVNQATQVNKTRREREQQQQEQRQVQRDTEITQAVSQMNNRPININLVVKQSLDGQDLTNKLLSAAVLGTNRYVVVTEDDGTMKLIDKTGQAQNNPIPSRR